MIGTPGLGKSTLSKNLADKYGWLHYTQDDYPNITKFIDAMKRHEEEDDSILIIDRCNEKIENRQDMMEVFPDVPYIFIDFININNKTKLKKVAQDRIKGRDPTGQSLIYDPKNNGYVAFMVIQKKLKNYQPPQKSENYTKLINITLGWSIEKMTKSIISIIDKI